VRIPGFTAQASLGVAAPLRGAAVFNDLGGNVIPATEWYCEWWVNTFICERDVCGLRWVCLEWVEHPA